MLNQFFQEKPTNNDQYINKRDQLFYTSNDAHVQNNVLIGKIISYVAAMRTSFTLKTFFWKEVSEYKKCDPETDKEF